jgi:hypothetical protein
VHDVSYVDKVEAADDVQKACEGGKGRPPDNRIGIHGIQPFTIADWRVRKAGARPAAAHAVCEPLQRLKKKK